MYANVFAQSDRPAFHISGREYSYLEFAERVRVAASMIADLCPKADMIGIAAHDDIETYSSIIAVLLSGKYGFVPLCPESPTVRLREIVRLVPLSDVLSSHKAEDSSRLGVSVHDTKQPIGERGIRIEENIPDPNRIAYLLFTSGTTGVPKGVPISYGNLEAFIQAFLALDLGLSAEDRFLQMFSLGFDFSIMTYIVPLCIGASVYTVPQTTLKQMAAMHLLMQENITFAGMVPSAIRLLRPYWDQIMLPQLRNTLFCGEALTTDLAEAWSRCAPNGKIINAYGPTEATVCCMQYGLKPCLSAKGHNRGVSIGKPMLGTEAVVIDPETARVLDVGQQGELCLNGPQVFSGYWKTDSPRAFVCANREGITKSYYRTGDVCFCDADGDFMFVGRNDEQIKIHGYRVELGEIEHKAMKFSSQIRSAVALSANCEGKGHQVHLVLEAENINASEIIGYLKRELPWYMAPSMVYCISSFPLNGNGKVDRAQLCRKLSPHS